MHKLSKRRRTSEMAHSLAKVVSETDFEASRIMVWLQLNQVEPALFSWILLIGSMSLVCWVVLSIEMLAKPIEIPFRNKRDGLAIVD